jgi:predicted transcriptional regulator
MTKVDLGAVFAKVRAWAPDLQEEAIEILLALEQDAGHAYELSPEELADIREGLAEAERGEFLTEEEVRHLFRRRL